MKARLTGDCRLDLFTKAKKAVVTPFLVGNFNGSTLGEDRNGGFLNQRKNQRGRPLAFTTEKKQIFLRELKKTWPNHSKACAAVHVSRWTLQNHLVMDTRFRECVEEIVCEKLDEIEAVAFAQAQTPSGVADRDLVLKAYQKL